MVESGVYKTFDGQDQMYFNWADGDMDYLPAYQCVIITRKSKLKWNDIFCYFPLQALCSKVITKEIQTQSESRESSRNDVLGDEENQDEGSQDIGGGISPTKVVQQTSGAHESQTSGYNEPSAGKMPISNPDETGAILPTSEGTNLNPMSPVESVLSNASVSQNEDKSTQESVLINNVESNSSGTLTKQVSSKSTGTIKDHVQSETIKDHLSSEPPGTTNNIDPRNPTDH